MGIQCNFFLHFFCKWKAKQKSKSEKAALIKRTKITFDAKTQSAAAAEVAAAAVAAAVAALEDTAATAFSWSHVTKGNLPALAWERGAL